MAAPAVPDSVDVIRDEGRTNALLRWDAVTLDVDGAAATITAYKVYQADTADQRYATLVKTVQANGSGSQVTVIENLLEDVLYYFTVAAVNDSAEEGATSVPETDF